jgi:ferredoxin
VIDDSRCISCAACTSVCPIVLDRAILDHWYPERQARVFPEG